jgi:hypothetical protein
MPTTQEYLERYKAVKRDPWEFVTKMVFTKDEVDRNNPIKRFPAYLAYQKLYMRLWQKYPKIIVPKSRRMMMSWTNIALYVWDTMFNVGRQQAFVSKKETDSHELIERAKFIVEHLDYDWIPKELLPKHTCKFGELSFPEIESRIMGFPSGADQLRQFTFSGMLFDEAAFWDNAEEAYSSSVPTIEGGGRMTLISSPAPGFFKRIVFDELQDSDIKSEREELPCGMFPMEGVEVWQNGKNKFVVFQLHYSADPKKQNPDWLDAIRSSMSISKFRQEYDLQWDTFVGKPVYPEFSENLHTSKERVYPEFGLPLILGIDQGLHAAVVICQLQGSKFVVMDEVRAENMGAERFVEKVKNYLSLNYPEWGNYERDFLCYMDPSGFNKRDVDERTYASVWLKAGFKKMFPGEMLWEPRRSAVEQYLVKQNKEGPCFVIDKAKAPILVRGFAGGYRYSEKAFEIEPMKARPIKDEYSDVHDALQYAMSGFFKTKNRSGKAPIPDLKYSNNNGGLTNGRTNLKRY